jgi:hypothetical protein
MQDSHSILIWTGFDPAPDGHGGNLRTAQIYELCTTAGFPPQPILREGRVSFPAKLAGGLQSRSGLRRAGIRLPLRSLLLAGFYEAILLKTLAAHRGARILLWEDTSQPLAALVARRLGYTVLALPQNIESLLGTRESTGPLGSEVAGLGLADRVFCIAEEESWLLSNLGVSSDLLPYYPVAKKRQAMEAIARRRAEGLADDAPWVIVGSANHHPTREGMRTVLRWVQPAVREGRKVVVGGFGTERIAGEFADSGVRFLGALTGLQLEELMAGARGILVHQDRGAGALTRIPEALIARVPVIANRVAARSTRGYDGVTVYDSQEELLAILRAGTPGVPSPFAPPAAAMGRFTSLLKSAADRHG